VLEAIEQQNRVTIEAVTGFRAEVERRFDDLERRHDMRFQTLEFAIRELGARVSALEVGMQRNTEEIHGLKLEVARLADAVRGKAEARDVAALAERVARLEARVGP